MLTIYGHPFSSYTWKVLIALYANDAEFEFRLVDAEHPENCAFVEAHSGPLAKFPLLVDGGNILFESSAIIEYLARHHAGVAPLLPNQPDAAIRVRMLDRVFDNYVMEPMMAIVAEHLRAPDQRDQTRCESAREKLEKSYCWLEGWLDDVTASPQITMVECAAVPALFYANWVHPIAASYPRLREWFAHLQDLPPIKRCIDEARPYRHFFPVPLPEPA